MNSTMKCFLIFTIVFLLVGLGTLAASDVTTNDTSVSKTTETSNAKIVNKDTNTVSKSLKKNDIVTETIKEKDKKINKKDLQKIRKTDADDDVSTFDELNTSLQKTGLVKINIKSNITLTDSLTVNKNIENLNINGNGFTINGNGTYKFLSTSARCNVTLTNLNVKNCSSTIAGGVIESWGNLTVDNCNLTNNTAIWVGGAICHQGNLIISNSNISSNNATSGGSVTYLPLELDSYINITDSNFFNNTGNSDQNGLGGAIFIDVQKEIFFNPSAYITNSNFTANNANRGGAIYSVGGSLSITGSKFKENNATIGGAIDHTGNLTITKTNMTDNNATYWGGAIFYAPSPVGNKMSISDSNFINNTLTSKENMPSGGAIYMDFINEYMYSDIPAAITNTNFTANKASYGGAIYFVNKHVLIKDSQFKENNADYGGAIEYTGNLTITNTNMTDNHATYDGGAIRNLIEFEESVLNITDSKFVNNSVSTDTQLDTMGGAIYMGPEEYSADLNNSAFITNTKFIDNYAVLGGAVTIYGGNLYLNDSTLENNSAMSGGAIYNLQEYGEELVIVGDNPVNNMKSLQIKNSKFTKNHAVTGGAICINGTLNVTLQNTNMTQNSGEDGGILYTGKNSNITIEGGTLKGNHANNTLLSSDKIDSLEISDSNFIDNYVTDNTGYVVDLQNINDIKIVDTKFDNNTDNKRDMLFSDAKEDAKIDIHGNNYTNNYLSVNLSKLSDFDARNLDNKTLTFPVKVTAREIYNHTIETGNIYFKTELIDSSSIVENSQSNIILDNKKLQNNTNTVNYNYTSIQKHYQNVKKSFNIFKEMKEAVIEEKIIDPTRDYTEITVKVNVEGEEINNAPITIKLPDGKIIETTSNKNIKLDLPVGPNEITIEYPGDITTKPATKPVTITVTPTPTSTTINIENPTAGNVKVTGTVKDKQGKNVDEGTVTIKDKDKVIGTATLKNGTYTTTVNLNKGTQTIYVQYNPTKNYTTSNNSTQINVKARNPVIKLDPVRGIIGENITLTAYLTDANGTPITGGNLAFKLNGKTLRSDGRFDSTAPAMKFKVQNGRVIFIIKADAYLRNAKNLTASYSGNHIYQETTSPTVEAQIQKRNAEITVQVTPSKQKQYETITITATLKDVTKNSKNTTAISQNSKVMLKINGKTLKDANNNTLYINVGKDNKAVYNYTIPAGTGGIKNGTPIDYKTEAVFVNDNYYPSARNTTSFNIEQSSTTLAIKEAKVDKNNLLSVKATLTDYKGNNLVGTNKISIKINGITLKNETGGARTWNATNGVIDLSGIQVDKNTTIKRVMVVSSERQAYSEARLETTNIIRV